ncbi:hypothetical protein Btru_073749 [Bulinus truncatus]|nr:hypothetical protein Btru_073749 [Bulinus truncatus]
MVFGKEGGQPLVKTDMETRPSAKKKRRIEEAAQVSPYNTRYSKYNTRKDEASSGKVEKFRLYGQHEVQISTGGETDLQKNVDGCTKNPGHTHFIPIAAFKKSPHS